MSDSVNYKRQVEDLLDQQLTLSRISSSLHNENKVLREVLADEITRRQYLEGELYKAQKKNKDYATVFHKICSELTRAARKEELVKSINAIMDGFNI